MEQLLEKLYQQVTSKAYGKYRGTVVDRDDPDNKGRIKVRVPAVLGDEQTDWALPCFQNGGSDGVGSIVVPEVDAQVWVEFEAGDPSSPIWTGTFFGADESLPDEALLNPPDANVVKTPKGSMLVISDEADNENIQLEHQTGQKLEMDVNGNVSLENSNGEKLLLNAEDGKLSCEDSNGNKIELTNSGITITDLSGSKIKMENGSIKIEASADVTLEAPMINLGGSGGEGVIKGQSFLNLYMAHTHPTGVGPSGPPIPMGEISTLSFKVKST